MATAETREADALASWIGRTTSRTDLVTPRLLDGFRATLSPHLFAGAQVPLGLFWCLAPDTFQADELGPDGHPRLGLVLPPIPYGRRMWAGGEVTLQGELAPGDEVRKTSTIEDIAFKDGRSGRLAFVTVRHHYEVGEQRVIDERQDIVYREGGGTGKAGPAPSAECALRWQVEATPTLLLRYSALTFNGHRIHYDEPYARTMEGYDGLVVHGPLQATVLLNAMASVLGASPRAFRYRGLVPLIAGAPFFVEVMGRREGALSAAVRSSQDIVTFTAAARGG